MQIDTDSIQQVLQDAEQGFLSPKSEQTFRDLISLRDKIDKAIKEATQAAEKILNAAKTLDK